MVDKLNEFMNNWNNQDWRNGIFFSLIVLTLIATLLFNIGNVRLDINEGDYSLFANTTEPLDKLIGFSSEIDAYEIYTGTYESGCMKNVEIRSLSPYGAKWTGTYCRNQLIPLYDWTLKVIEVYPDEENPEKGKAVVKKIKHYDIPYWLILVFFGIIASILSFLTFILKKLFKKNKKIKIKKTKAR